ncbi:hypothetical protein H6G89_19880 [Oscillatoria sp. FACHB-1407]|uniref:slr1601 family putative cell division protein n=1 Tax=Oscillatoria sp. FACHB-1407 TaxID=2692847 RepID=UPI001686DF91|nr:hypothetical protein [Oscillatoria sp. FACHB-1407]MBD2463299.1 hypothetical protein [Oscillatoria sp. FACHB-1407]
MNATQPTRPPLQPLPSTRRTPIDSHRRQPRQLRQAHHRRHRAIAIELSARLVANVVLGAVALVALVKLVPYNQVQQARLQELQTELTLVEGRVAQLQTSFNRQFDPRQSLSVMQEQSNRIAPGQRQVVWTTPPDATPISHSP